MEAQKRLLKAVCTLYILKHVTYAVLCYIIQNMMQRATSEVRIPSLWCHPFIPEGSLCLKTVHLVSGPSRSFLFWMTRCSCLVKHGWELSCLFALNVLHDFAHSHMLPVQWNNGKTQISLVMLPKTSITTSRSLTSLTRHVAMLKSVELTVLDRPKAQLTDIQI